MNSPQSCLWLVPLVLLAGCGKGKKDGDKPKKKDPPIIQNVGVGAGYTTVFKSSDPTSPTSFNVKWVTGGFKAGDSGIEIGHLITVSGDLFSNGQKSSRYSAQRADAVRETKRLTMTGNVVFQSADGKTTLRSPKGEYRGDVGLVRAMDGVTVTGPFGTLSGVPELWATPDLRIIGTPDMFSQKLRIPALVALASTAAIGSPKLQNPTYDVDGNKSSLVEVTKTGYRSTLDPKPGGPIVVTMASRGLVFQFSKRVIIDFVGKSLDVTHMTTDGAVNVVQTTTVAKTTLDGTSAQYDWKPGAANANLDLAGPVKIVKLAKVKSADGKMVDQTTTSRGNKGSALLVNKPKANEDGIKSVTLDGNVDIAVSEVDGQSFTGSGDRMVYTPNGETASVDISGRTTLTSIAKGKDAEGKPTLRTVISKGDHGTANLLSKPADGANPLRDATLLGNVTIDVTGSNDENFKGTGDKLVYTAAGEGGKAVMTGDLKFSGDTPTFFGNMDADTAVMMLGKKGWESIYTTKEGGKVNTTIVTKPSTKPPETRTDPKKGGPKKGKGGAQP